MKKEKELRYLQNLLHNIKSLDTKLNRIQKMNIKSFSYTDHVSTESIRDMKMIAEIKELIINLLKEKLSYFEKIVNNLNIDTESNKYDISDKEKPNE